MLSKSGKSQVNCGICLVFIGDHTGDELKISHIFKLIIDLLVAHFLSHTT